MYCYKLHSILQCSYCIIKNGTTKSIWVSSTLALNSWKIIELLLTCVARQNQLYEIQSITIAKKKMMCNRIYYYDYSCPLHNAPGCKIFNSRWCQWNQHHQLLRLGAIPGFLSYRFRYKFQTMPAKSLWTLTLFLLRWQQKNPFHLKQCWFSVVWNIPQEPAMYLMKAQIVQK